jgi:hypothetical protein
MMQLVMSLWQLFMSVGGLVIFFAVYPTTGSAAGVTFQRAKDFSHMKVEIVAARPRMMMWGTIAVAIGVVGSGIMTLLEVFGVLPK